MSRNRYVEDIRKIVKIDVNQKTLGSADRRSNIEAKKGIAYNTAQVGGQALSGNSQTLGGTLGSDWFSDGSLDVEEGSGDEEAGEEQGNSQDPSKPGRSSHTYDQGTHDVEDVIDNAPGTPNLPDTIPQGLDGRPLNNGGTLNGLTGGFDCDSGKELDIRMDKLMRPPEGWDSVDNPGDVTDPDNGFYQWEAGRQWEAPWATVGGPSYATTALAAAKLARDASGDGDKTNILNSTFDSNFPHVGGSIRWIFEFENPSSHAVATYYAQDQTCTPDIDDPLCPLTNPNRWPADGKMQIILNSDGTYKAAELEAPEDIVTKYTDNLHSRIDFCFGSGRFGSIIPAINGGYIIAETLTEGGTITGTAKLFNSQNKVIAYVSDQTYQNFLPR